MSHRFRILVLLASVFAELPPGAPEREAAWLAEAFGGPQRGGATALAGRDLSPAQRARWVALAVQAADEARLPDDPAFRAAIVAGGIVVLYLFVVMLVNLKRPPEEYRDPASAAVRRFAETNRDRVEFLARIGLRINP